MKYNNIVLATSVVFLMLFASCESKIIMSKQEASERIASIKKGMTFDEVKNVVPLSKSHEVMAKEHGGTWYSVPISSNYLVEVRFSSSQSTKGLAEPRVNHSPRLKKR